MTKWEKKEAEYFSNITNSETGQKELRVLNE
jgi:hypothetical protein